MAGYIKGGVGQTSDPRRVFLEILLDTRGRAGDRFEPLRA